MSGHKRATIQAPTQNLRQFSEAEVALRFVEAGNAQLQAELSRQVALQVEQIEQQRQQDDQQLVSALSQVDGAFARLESDTQAALTQQSQQFSHDLAQLAGEYDTFNRQQLEQVSQHHLAQVQALADAHAHDLRLLSEQLDAIHQSGKARQVHASSWLQAAFTLSELVQADPAISQVESGKVLASRKLLDQALDNFNAGFPEAALIHAQKAYTLLSSARLNTQRLIGEYHALAQQLALELTRLKQAIELNRQVPVMDAQGRTYAQTIDVDQWCAGALSQIEQQVQASIADLPAPFSMASLTNLKRTLHQNLPTWTKQVQECVFQARSHVLTSQLRMNIARLVVTALASQGYYLDGSGYAGEDMRQGYLAEMVDVENSRIVIHVEPASGSSGTVELNLDIEDIHKRTPHEIRHRSLEIQRSLHKAGLQVGELLPVNPENRPYRLGSDGSRTLRLREQRPQGGYER